MKRVKIISKSPELGATIAPEVKLAFVIDVLEASVPLFVNKDPQNPATPPADTEGEAE